MFDSNKLKHFLDSLQIETHFPDRAPKALVELPRSVLDRLMDRYDILKQADGEYENVSTPEYPVLAPKSAFDNPMYMPMQWQSVPWAQISYYSGINRMSAYVTGVDTSVSEAPPAPIETHYDRFKKKLSRLSAVSPTVIPSPEPPAPSRSPDYTHTITGWRGWEVTNGMLEALGTASRWEPRRAPKANCHTNSNHVAPRFDCQCGYWSFRTRDLLEQALETYAPCVNVIGQVEIWGRVIECENGWRSEYSYPKELWLLNEGLEHLGWRYGVPVRSLG